MSENETSPRYYFCIRMQWLVIQCLTLMWQANCCCHHSVTLSCSCHMLVFLWMQPGIPFCSFLPSVFLLSAHLWHNRVCMWQRKHNWRKEKNEIHYTCDHHYQTYINFTLATWNDCVFSSYYSASSIYTLWKENSVWKWYHSIL